jgi:aspartate racemase
MNKRIGILGGMGPLASAEFVGTLYRLNITDPEQDAPVCVMISDPTFPDRTERILRGDTGELAKRLASALAELTMMGADAIVITCVTVHHVLDQVPPHLRGRVISLIDLLADEIAAEPRRRLLLTTTGTREARIFERHRCWPEIARSIELPSAEDQEILHGLIYSLKRGEHDEAGLDWLAGLPSRYGTTGCIFGCTELHLVHRGVTARLGTEKILDPLMLVARKLSTLIDIDSSTARSSRSTKLHQSVCGSPRN